MKIQDIVIIGALFLTLTGCGKNDSNNFPEPAAHKPEVTFDTSDEIYETAKEIDSSKFRSFCDEKTKSKRDELIKLVLTKKQEISDYYSTPSANPTPNSKYTWLKLGPARFYKYKTPPVPEKGWVKEPDDSWEDLWSWYETVKAQNDIRDIVSLNRLVRSLMLNDKTRAKGSIYAISPFDKEKMQALVEKFTKCESDRQCKNVELTEWERNYFATSEFFKLRIKFLEESAAEGTREATIITRIAEYLREDYEIAFGFTKNQGIKTDGNTLKVPMIAGVFESVKEEVARLIETYWQQADVATGVKTKIVWNTEPDFAHTLEFRDSSGGRLYVHQGKLVIYQDARLTSLFHEFGHVIGLRDKYYTVWNPDSCSYSTYSNEEEIMSVSSIGSITDEDWSEIKKGYDLN